MMLLSCMLDFVAPVVLLTALGKTSEVVQRLK